jgi:hypothetical protein
MQEFSRRPPIFFARCVPADARRRGATPPSARPRKRPWTLNQIAASSVDSAAAAPYTRQDAPAFFKEISWPS